MAVVLSVQYKYHLNTTAYLTIVVDHVHPFVHPPHGVPIFQWLLAG